MAEKTLDELAEEAQILADDLLEMVGKRQDPLHDIFKPNDPVTVIQLRQMAYKMRIEASKLLDKAVFMEQQAVKMDEYPMSLWRMYCSLYLDAVEDQSRKALYCLTRMEEEAQKARLGSDEPSADYANRSMARELSDMRKEVEEMMD